MNLESKELPKSFLGSSHLGNDWQCGGRQCCLLIHTHISHIIMCWNNAEWVVSVVSHLLLESLYEMSRSRRQRGLSRRCFLCKVHNSGAARDCDCFFTPLFYLRLYRPVSCAQLHKIMTEEQTLSPRGRTKLSRVITHCWHAKWATLL